MNAKERTLISLLREKCQFIIPIYQRTYSWTQKQCEKLFEDILTIKESHFIGSVVRVEKALDSSEIPEQIIIDGQQRITTIILLLIAIARQNESRRQELTEEFLINKFAQGDLRYKIMLTQEDRSSLISLIDNRFNEQLNSTRIKENFEFFTEKLKGQNTDDIWNKLRNLVIVDISLDKKADDPQLIFESLNSTGLELSQGDLIRNFILMGLTQEQQNNLYINYWRVMEKNFGQSSYSTEFSSFMRHYLTVKNGEIPNINNVYLTFKNYFDNNGGLGNVENIIKDIYKFSTFYTKIALNKEENLKLKKCFISLNKLKVDVAYPFLLNIYNDFEDNIINEEGFIEITNLIESYVFRRFVCGIPTNSLNKTFATLYNKINHQCYIESLKVKMTKFTSYQRFPDDDEFKQSLHTKDLYNIKNRNFWLSKLENFGKKEFVKVDECTVEHIMPQNPNLSSEWQNELGEQYREVHSKYLHTLGNLTLTGYNSELSDKSFTNKKEIFKKSPLRLNLSLVKFDNWNENSIKERANFLIQDMLQIWAFPIVTQEVLNKYKEQKAQQQEYTIESMEGGHFLEKGKMKELFKLFRTKVMNIDSEVKEEFRKLYITYKVDTIFLDVVPLQNQLRLSLNTDIDKLHDPQNLCINIKDKGSWGNGNVRIYLNSKEQLEDVFYLIRQSYNVNVQN